MTNKQVATSNGTSLAVNQEKVIPGLEGIERDILIIPRLKIVQKNSIEIDNKLAKPGEIVNSVTKDIFTKEAESLILVPICKSVNTRNLYRPFSEGGGILCRSFDGITGQGDPGGDCVSCLENQWTVDDKNKKKAPNCTEYLNVFCIVRGYDYPIPLTASFGRTGIPAGKQLINFFWADAQKAQKSPWNFAYQLKTELVGTEPEKYYVPKINPEGIATKEEIKKGELFYNLIKSTEIEIHVDEDEIKAEQENIEKESPMENNEDPFGPSEDEKK